MRSDRGTKMLHGMIAVGVWALTMTQLEAPRAMAVEPESSTETAAVERRVPMESGIAQSTVGPLRWRIGYAGAEETNAGGSNQCFTSVSLVNTSAVSIDAEVEFFGWDDLSVGSATPTVPPQGSVTVIAHESGFFTEIPPFNANALVVVTGGFAAGFAQVYADDPRILTTAFLVCARERVSTSDALQELRSMAHIPAFPVGATLEYFRAGMPATWTPQVVVPE